MMTGEREVVRFLGLIQDGKFAKMHPYDHDGMDHLQILIWF
jgi:hypothetical protein